MSHPQSLPPPAAKHLPEHHWGRGGPWTSGNWEGSLKLPDVMMPLALSPEGLEDKSGFTKDARKTVTVGGWAQEHRLQNPQLPALGSQALERGKRHLRVTQREEEMVPVYGFGTYQIDHLRAERDSSIAGSARHCPGTEKHESGR